MTHLVGFRTSRFDVANETANPINPIAGQSVLAWLRGELEQARYSSTDPAAEDWGWYIDVKSGDASYLVGASAEADGPTPKDVEWIIQVHKHRTLMDKVLGRNKLAADDPLTALIERLVRADPRIVDVSIDRGA